MDSKITYRFNGRLELVRMFALWSSFTRHTLAEVPSWEPVLKDPEVKGWYSRCHHHRGATQADANNAADLLFQELDFKKGQWLAPGACMHGDGNTTVLFLCNTSKNGKLVTYEDAASLHQHLMRDCGNKENRARDGTIKPIPFGGLRHEDGLELNSWGVSAEVVEPEGLDERSLEKRNSLDASFYTNWRVKNEQRRYCDPLRMPLDGSLHRDCKKPQHHELDDRGDCPLPSKEDHPCMSYCEETRRYMWGPEQPYPQTGLSACPPGATACTWSDGLSVSLAKGWLSQIGLQLPTVPELPIGAAGVWTKLANLGNIMNFAYAELETKTEGVSQTGSHSMAGKEDWCGYWTFIPMVTWSCGTVSIYRRQEKNNYGDGPGCVPYRSEPPVTYKDQCGMKPITGADGKPLGQSIVVFYDCTSRKLAPDYEQNPLYLMPNVAAAVGLGSTSEG